MKIDSIRIFFFIFKLFLLVKMENKYVDECKPNEIFGITWGSFNELNPVAAWGTGLEWLCKELNELKEFKPEDKNSEEYSDWHFDKCMLKDDIKEYQDLIKGWNECMKYNRIFVNRGSVPPIPAPIIRNNLNLNYPAPGNAGGAPYKR